jgi:cysteine desulfuration protein SufE
MFKKWVMVRPLPLPSCDSFDIIAPMTDANIAEKILLLKERFKKATSPKDISLEIMSFAKTLPPMPEQYKTLEHKVQGCQSSTYLSASLKDSLLYFQADSDALISRGIAAIFVFIYSEQSPSTILQTPPEFVKEMGILSSLSPSRANGLISLFSKMKLTAIKALQDSELHNKNS